MLVVIDGEQRIRVIAGGGDEALEIRSESPGTGFSPLHMLAASLATCTVSVLAGWAVQVGIPLQGLEIHLSWDYVDDPYRVGTYVMDIVWPELPEERRAAAERVAAHCTVEHTLRHPPEILTRVRD